MGTRSKIGILKSDGKVDAIYCHWDGYPSYNGQMLVDNYTDASKVRKLISLGDISSLVPSLDHVNSYYGWREEEAPKRTYEDIKAYEKAYGDCWDEYNYLYNNGIWYVFNNNETINNWEEVTEVLKRAE